MPASFIVYVWVFFFLFCLPAFFLLFSIHIYKFLFWIFFLLHLHPQFTRKKEYWKKSSDVRSSKSAFILLPKQVINWIFNQSVFSWWKKSHVRKLLRVLLHILIGVRGKNFFLLQCVVMSHKNVNDLFFALKNFKVMWFLISRQSHYLIFGNLWQITRFGCMFDWIFYEFLK